MSFNHQGNYICECGKQFDNSQAFNGHKSHCTVHADVNGKSDLLMADENQRHKKTSETMKKKFVSKHKAELDQWLSEQHLCERCGKVMTERYGSGRFCCKSCASSHQHTSESRFRISQALKASTKKNGCYRKQSAMNNYYSDPHYCVICGKELPYEKRSRKTCSIECKLKLQSDIANRIVEMKGGNMNPRPNQNCKTGWYNGIHFDSSWELAFIIYHLEHNILLKRNYRGFPYIFNGKQHIYYPDFVINGIFYEVKNFKTNIVLAKLNQFPADLKLVVLYKEDMKVYLEYCINKYGPNFWKDFCN